MKLHFGLSDSDTAYYKKRIENLHVDRPQTKVIEYGEFSVYFIFTL